MTAFASGVPFSDIPGYINTPTWGGTDWAKNKSAFKPLAKTTFDTKDILKGLPFPQIGLDMSSGKRDQTVGAIGQQPTAETVYQSPLGEVDETIGKLSEIQNRLFPTYLEQQKKLAWVELQRGLFGTAAYMPLQALAGEIATNRALRAYEKTQAPLRNAQIASLQQSGRLAASQGFAAELEAVARAQDAATNAAINRYYKGPSYA